MNDDQVTYYASGNRDLQPSEGEPSPLLLSPEQPLPDPPPPTIQQQLQPQVDEVGLPLPLPPPTPTSAIPPLEIGHGVIAAQVDWEMVGYCMVRNEGCGKSMDYVAYGVGSGISFKIQNSWSINLYTSFTE